jgi:CubicO group peptidase (beta-lactamase class C family)
LLAAVIERTEERSFAEAMQAYLRQRGMTSASFWPATIPGTAARGRVLKDGQPKFLEPGWFGSRYAIAFTGLWTSMPDLARFGAALAGAATDPRAPLHAMTVLDTPVGHGLGPVHRQRHGYPTLEHDGSGPGFMAWLIAIPARELGFATVCNGGNETRDEGRQFAALAGSMVEVVLEPAASAAPPR